MADNLTDESPRGTDLKSYTQTDLNSVAALSQRPTPQDPVIHVSESRSISTQQHLNSTVTSTIPTGVAVRAGRV